MKHAVEIRWALVARLILGLALALTCTPRANAADCTLTQVADLDLVTSQTGELLLPVSLNGSPRFMELNLNAAYSALFDPVADELSLTRHRLPEGITVTIKQATVSGQVRLSTIQVGNLRGDDFDILSVPQLEGVDPREAGVMGLDFLSNADAELDLAHGKLKLFSSDHCPGQVVYWTSKSGIASVPLNFQPTGQIVVDVTLDGKPIHAGLSVEGRTVMEMASATRVFGLSAQSPGMTQVATQGGAQTRVYRYPFASLSVSGLAVTNPRIAIIEDSSECDEHARFESGPAPTGSNLGTIAYRCYGGEDLFIGRSVLEKLHLYFAFKEKTLYVTAADEDAAPAPAATTAPAALAKPSAP